MDLAICSTVLNVINFSHSTDQLIHHALFTKLNDTFDLGHSRLRYTDPLQMLNKHSNINSFIRLINSEIYY